MKKVNIALLINLLTIVCVKAQIPNFGGSIGKQNLYGYTSMKYRAGINNWETYSTVQYGVFNYFQIGTDLYTCTNTSYVGYVFRGGYKFNPFFNIGAQITPSFNLSNKHKYGFLTSAFYMNGEITNDGRLFWVTNTWIENNNHGLASANQWSYFGYTFNLPNNKKITPMLGMIHSWKFDKPVDLSLGAYYTYKNINFYVWSNDLFTKNPRFVLALEFTFSNK